MRITDYFMLAARSIRRQKLRSALAISAIVIGSASIALVLSLVFGARQYYLNQLESSGKLRQVIVSPQTNIGFEESQLGIPCDNCVSIDDEMVTTIAAYPGVVHATPVVNVNVFESIALEDQQQLVRNMQGYRPHGAVQHNLLAGQSFSAHDSVGKVIIGKNYADRWGYQGKYQELIGREVVLTTNRSYTGEGAQLPDPMVQFKKCQEGNCTPEDIIDQLQPTQIRAIIVGIETVEPVTVFVPLSWAQQLLQVRYYEITAQDQATYLQAYTQWEARGRAGDEPRPNFTLMTDSPLQANGYSSLVIEVDNEDDATAVAERIRELGVGAVTARAYIESQLQLFGIISLILGGLGAITLIVAAIGVINIMIMAVMERTREIGVMRAVGAKRSAVGRLFTLEASLLGLLGGVIGVTIGYLLIGFSNLVINTELAADGSISRNIISLPPQLALVVIVAATLIGMLAGLYPARRAARLSPVEALRHE